jgi:hypothetical protein
MKGGKLHQHRSSSICQVHAHKATVTRDWRLANQVRPHRAVHQSDHRIVPLLQKLLQLGNRSPAAPCESRDTQHQLMLLRRHPRGARGLLAEAQESPELETKLGKLPDSFRGRIRRRPQRSRRVPSSHLFYIISRRDIYRRARSGDMFFKGNGFARSKAVKGQRNKGIVRRGEIARLESAATTAAEAAARKSAAAES